MERILDKQNKNFKIITRQTKKDGGGYIWEVFHPRSTKPTFKSPRVYKTIRVCNMRARDFLKHMKEWFSIEAVLIDRITESDDVAS